MAVADCKSTSILRATKCCSDNLKKKLIVAGKTYKIAPKVVVKTGAKTLFKHKLMSSQSASVPHHKTGELPNLDNICSNISVLQKYFEKDKAYCL